MSIILNAKFAIRRGDMRGAAAVELALVSIILVMLVLAAVDFARAMFVYDQLVKSARDGVRYLSFFDPSVPGNYPIALAKNRMIYGSVNGGGNTIVPGLTADKISVCDRVNSNACPGEIFADVPTGSGSINLVTVKISGYQYDPIFPGVSKVTTLTFEPISVTMRQLY
jgi:hypothetical protein